MTVYYIVHEKNVCNVIDDEDKELSFMEDNNCFEFTWQYKNIIEEESEDSEEDFEWIDCLFDELPEGFDFCVNLAEYKAGAMFRRPHECIDNPSENEFKELVRETVYDAFKNGDIYNIYTDSDFVDGEWMGDEDQWIAEGYREKIEGYNYIFENYPKEDEND